jgi:hypothetical protein
LRRRPSTSPKRARDVLERLMTLLYWLRHPTAKPPVAESADARLDEVERRLDEVRQRRLQLELDNFRRRS